MAFPERYAGFPFEEPQHIQMVNTGRNGCLFAISFNHGHVYAVWKGTFQVASCWSGVSSINVDYFVGCGTDQMLLVFGSQSPPVGPVDQYLITDLCGTTYSHGQESSEGRNTSDTAQENYLLTIEALQARLPIGLTSHQDLQRCEGEGSTPVSPSPHRCGLRKRTRSYPDRAVDKLCHRVIEDRLIVDVKLTTERTMQASARRPRSSRPTAKRPGSPHPAPPHTKTPSPCSHPEPAAKRSRRDGASGACDTDRHRLAVTAVTDLTPLLTSGSVKCAVMLHYVHRQGSSGSPTAPLEVTQYEDRLCSLARGRLRRRGGRGLKRCREEWQRNSERCREEWQRNRERSREEWQRNRERSREEWQRYRERNREEWQRNREEWQRNREEWQRNRERSREEWQRNREEWQRNRERCREEWQRNRERCKEEWQRNRERSREEWQRNWERYREEWQRNRERCREEWQRNRERCREEWQRNRERCREEWQRNRERCREEWQMNRERCREEWQRNRERRRRRRRLSPLVGVERYRRLTQSLAQ
ncbi:unnamed protein product, partial [Coregonus sp. 'balchen']